MSRYTVVEPTVVTPEAPRREHRRVLVPALLTGLLGVTVVGAVALFGGSSPNHPAITPAGAGGGSGTYGSEISMGPQAMEGDLKLANGSTFHAGYDFNISGTHAADTVTFVNPTWTFVYTCTNGLAGGTVTLTAPSVTFSGITDSDWHATGDQASGLSYESNTATVNGQCGTGEMRLQPGGTFTSAINATTTAKVAVRWHYQGNNTSGSWSGTGNFPPGPGQCYPINCI